MSLANLQTDFMDCLLGKKQQDTAFTSKLSVVKQLTQSEQLAIYRGNLNGAHGKVLQQIYPAIYRILGEDYFNQLTRLYRFEYPSTNPDLNCYGQKFSAFLVKQMQSHDELGEFPYLPELAQHEWSWHNCYFAEDNQHFDFEQFAQLQESDYDRLIFVTSPSLSLHQTNYPIVEIWQANRQPTKLLQSFTMPEKANYYCIFRPVHKPEYVHIEQQQHQLLTALIKGETFAQLTVQYSSLLQESLPHYIERQWVTGFQLLD